uniref:Olfactory receptor n=1 Tax=Cercocebus atys TaxID=9531 RepID=A0A2K5NXL1_CERAT
MTVIKNVTEIIFLGFSQNRNEQRVVSVMFLLMCTAVVPGNGLIVVNILASKGLTSPVYFLLSYVSFVEICYCSFAAPKLIFDSFIKRKVISLNGCITQIFFLHFFGGAEIFLLMVMAYDRYMAICKPLHYTAIMNQQMRSLLVGVAWGGSLLHSNDGFQLHPCPYKGHKLILFYGCIVFHVVYVPLIKRKVTFLFPPDDGGSISVVSFSVRIASYLIILHSLRSHNSEARRRELSTCASHVTVVGLFFMPCVTLPADKIVAVFYTVVTPLLNPVIYSFRNAEVKNAMRRLVGRKVI